MYFWTQCQRLIAPHSRIHKRLHLHRTFVYASVHLASSSTFCDPVPSIARLDWSMFKNNQSFLVLTQDQAAAELADESSGLHVTVCQVFRLRLALVSFLWNNQYQLWVMKKTTDDSVCATHRRRQRTSARVSQAVQSALSSKSIPETLRVSRASRHCNLHGRAFVRGEG